MTRLWYARYWLSMTLHELLCGKDDYNVYNGPDWTFVIHQRCGKVWLA